MKFGSLPLLAVLFSCLLPARLPAAEKPLTLTRVIELASEAAPEVRLAASRVAVEEAKLAGADVRALENPRLGLFAGPRSGDGTSADLAAELEVPVELGQRREKRVDLARAGIRRETLAAGEARRGGVAAAVSAYYRVLHAEEQLALGRARGALAAELADIARRRHAAGDVARFEVNLAQTELVRAESEVAAATGKIAAARGALARALGLPSAAELAVAGNIRDRGVFDAAIARPAPESRSDLLAAEAEVKAAGAAVRLAEADTRPDLALHLSVKREGGENVALAGVSVALPFFNPRTAQVREARVQQERARTAAKIARNTLAAEVEGARGAYAAAVQAASRMETDGIPLQEENEALANESYRAGKINLSTLLQLRRDALETRQEYLDRLKEAAEAGVEFVSACGAWPGTQQTPR